MKKIFSLLLSAVMLISTLCAVDLSAFALSVPDVKEITPGQSYMVDVKNPDEDIALFSFEVKAEGDYYFYSTGTMDTLCAASVGYDDAELFDDEYGDNFMVELYGEEGDTFIFAVGAYEAGSFEVVLSTEAPEDYLPAPESISFTPANEIFVYEGVYDYRTEDEDGNLVEYYDIEDQLVCDGNVMEITYSNGVTVTYTSVVCNETDEDGTAHKYVEYRDNSGKYLPIDDYNIWIGSLEGSDIKVGKYDVLLSYRDVETTFSVTVKENPVKSIEYTPVKDVVLKEGVDNYVDCDEDGNLYNIYFVYESVGDTLKVNYTDGTSKTFTCVETDGDENFEEPHLHFVCGDEIIDDYIVGTDELESEPGTYTTQFEYFARTCDFTYTIEETDIEDITVKPVKTELVKGIDSDLIFGFNYYYCPDFTVAVEYKDGSVKEYPISLESEEKYPVSISIYDDQLEYDEELDDLVTWEPGETHEFTVYCTPEIFDTIEVEIVDCEHKNTQVVSYDATCTEDGCIDAVVCLDCGDVLDEGEIIEAPGHNYDDDNIIFSPATMENDGYYYNECTVCGEPDGMIIPMVDEIILSRTEINYTGTVQRPLVTVVDCDGEELVYKQDFTVSYSNWNSTNVGEYKVTVNLIGNYDGTYEYTYKILPQTRVTPKLNRTAITMTGTVQRPLVTVTDVYGNQLVYKKDFTVSYSNWNSKDVGRYTVTVKMQGNYSGTYTYPYYINPKPTTISSVTAKSKGFTVKWNKQTNQTTGYQIQYATKKDFSNAATIYGGPSTATSKTINGRAGKTRYYVRIRTYKNIGGKYFYSTWSSAKSVVTLK